MRAERLCVPLARAAIFVIYFWFGCLKAAGFSPAEDLVSRVAEALFPGILANGFCLWLGAYEIVVGIAFLVPRIERPALALLLLHMAATFLPLAFLADDTWQAFLVPTLIGQYIVKNLAILACGLLVYAFRNGAPAPTDPAPAAG